MNNAQTPSTTQIPDAPNTAHTEQTSRSGHPSLIISPELFDHFRHGDGVQLVNETTRERVFLHHDQLDFGADTVQELDKLNDVRDSLALLNAMIAAIPEGLQLNDSAVRGLSNTLMMAELKLEEAAFGLG